MPKQKGIWSIAFYNYKNKNNCKDANILRYRVHDDVLLIR